MERNFCLFLFVIGLFRLLLVVLQDFINLRIWFQQTGAVLLNVAVDLTLVIIEIDIFGLLCPMSVVALKDLIVLLGDRGLGLGDLVLGFELKLLPVRLTMIELGDLSNKSHLSNIAPFQQFFL